MTRRQQSGASVAKRKAAKSQPKPKGLELAGGTTLPLDGDLVYLVDALYKEFALKREFAPSYPDVQREIGRILDQMDKATTREYFASSIFLNYVTYENEMADRLADKLTRRPTEKTKKR